MDNMELKKYLDEQLSQTKLALENELASAKINLNEYFKNKLELMISDLMLQTEASNNTYVQMYKNSLVHIEKRRSNGASETILNAMTKIAQKSLSSGLETNRLILFDFIHFCRKQLNK